MTIKIMSIKYKESMIDGLNVCLHSTETSSPWLYLQTTVSFLIFHASLQSMINREGNDMDFTKNAISIKMAS